MFGSKDCHAFGSIENGTVVCSNKLYQSKRLENCYTLTPDASCLYKNTTLQITEAKSNLLNIRIFYFPVNRPVTVRCGKRILYKLLEGLNVVPNKCSVEAENFVSMATIDLGNSFELNEPKFHSSKFFHFLNNTQRLALNNSLVDTMPIDEYRTIPEDAATYAAWSGLGLMVLLLAATVWTVARRCSRRRRGNKDHSPQTDAPANDDPSPVSQEIT